MDYTTMTVEQLEERRAAIATEVDNADADLDALEAEARVIKDELERRKAAETKRVEIRAAVAEGAGETKETIHNDETEETRMFGIETIEYRDAWTKRLVGREMNEEERAALTSAGAVIPTMTVNAVWDKLIKPAELLGRVDVSQFPNYVRFPKATTNNAATAQAVGATITESSDVIGYVDLIPNEYVKLLTVGADIDHMAIAAVHDWIVDNLVGQIRYAINKDALVGTGTNSLKGISASVSASSTAIPATLTKAALLGIMAALGGNYQQGAIWIMSPEMFFNEVMALTALNDYIINDGFQYKLFGHDVVLMSEAVVSSKENIFYGDPKAYKVNIFKPIEVKPFETATTTNLQFRGACLADGELLDTAAFVRFQRSGT
jgi:HK97 family phage major capsid protein